MMFLSLLNYPSSPSHFGRPEKKKENKDEDDAATGILSLRLFLHL